MLEYKGYVGIVYTDDGSVTGRVVGIRDVVTFEDLKELKETIKDEMPEWLATMERYDDLANEDMDEVWGFK